MRSQRYVWPLAAWLAGAGLAALAEPDGHPAEMPPVSSNNWGQHTPRTGPQKAEPEADAREAGLRALRPTLVTPLADRAGAPRVPEGSYVDARALLWGDVRLGGGVLIAPFASLRADEGAPIRIGAGSNVQDGAVVHGLPVRAQGRPIPTNVYEVRGQRYSVYVGERVSIEHQAQLHGPVWIEDDVWVGMQALVSGSRVARGVVIEPAAVVLGVRIPPHRYVPAGVVVDRQSVADRLPEITASYPLRRRNRVSVHASRTLVEAYVRAASRSAAP